MTMKLTRRNFIASVVGGAVGIQITPLPWKFTDDVAIWTQNWPWVPVPPSGEFSEVSSVCTLCPGGCGISVRKVEERAVKIEGRTDYPVNPGGICPLGMGGLQLLYDESLRFTGPMKRVGMRGSGEFQRITWREALDIAGARIAALRKEGRPEAVAAVDGNGEGTTASLLIQRLMQAVGSPNYVRPASLSDTYRMGNILMQGRDAPIAYDLENSDLIVSFGCGLLEGWGAPGRVLNAWGMWHEGNPAKRKAKIVQVESRASNTASKADYWVAAKPGTEGALALGLAHVIIRSGRYDAGFLAEHAFGFDDWQSRDGVVHTGFKTLVLKNYAPEQVSRITGVRPDAIVKLAGMFMDAKSPIAIYGKGKDELNGSLYEFMAVQSLNALAGRINRVGGVLLPDPLPLNPLPHFECDEIAAKGLEKPRLDRAGTKAYPFSHSLIHKFAEAINGSRKSPIDTLLVFSANPAFTLPDGGAFETALKKIPFVISFSPYRDETANMADLILPDCVYLEKVDDIIWPVGLQYPLYGLSKPVVDPIYDTRNCGDTIINLSKAIGKSVGAAFPWKHFTDVLKERAKGLYDAGGGLVRFNPAAPPWVAKGAGSKTGFKSFDDMWKKLEAGGMWYRPAEQQRDWSWLFKTPSGKFEFYSQRIEQAIRSGSTKEMRITVQGDEACMAHYEAPAQDPDRTAYPLTLFPYEMINLASGWIPSPPFLYKTIFDTQLLKDTSFAAIHPGTAGQYGLKQGDLVSVESPAGAVKVRVDLFEGAMPGRVYMPLGFGHTGYDEFLKGKGANPNAIVRAGEDPVSGYPVWWTTPVKLVKA